jgi:hypothetical protein
MNVRAIIIITVAFVILLRDFGPYRIIFVNVCVVIMVFVVMLLRVFGPYGIVFLAICVYSTFMMGYLLVI